MNMLTVIIYDDMMYSMYLEDMGMDVNDMKFHDYIRMDACKIL